MLGVEQLPVGERSSLEEGRSSLEEGRSSLEEEQLEEEQSMPVGAPSSQEVGQLEEEPSSLEEERSSLEGERLVGEELAAPTREPSTCRLERRQRFRLTGRKKRNGG
mmetsp:Transcript_20781/g.69394  ORF Transcript_20781/g.69394 Transcript_20781/m.69394 type:complete len:107 (-) Transcript_20781:369-689(-)